MTELNAVFSVETYLIWCNKSISNEVHTTTSASAHRLTYKLGTNTTDIFGF